MNAAPGGAATAATDLPFDRIYRRPVGPRGLEFSEFATSLAGRRVRIVGHVVRQTAPVPFTLIFAPLPVMLHEREYGLAEDLPVTSVHVHYPRGPHPIPPWSPAAQVVEGILELGAREEADGRISHVRLRADRPWMPSSSASPR